MPITDLATILAGLDPVLDLDVAVYVALPADRPWPIGPADLGFIGAFREAEGWTLILTERLAEQAGLEPVFRAACITLKVASDLAAVGLTAAVSRVLAEAGISCNVVAAVHHDHIFVPEDQASRAMAVLISLQDTGAR